ncbi:MAG: hypothetical protein ABSF46_13020 [Terriglobia bacterium]|jgi:hypothetical protein
MNGARHSLALELPALAEFTGFSNIETTMIFRHAAREQKSEATVKLQAYVEVAPKTEQLQEKQQAESFKLPEDEWGNPIYQSAIESPQNLPQEAEIENLQF